MAVTEAGRNTSYTATLNLGVDADQVLGVYQVHVTLSHEWGEVVVDSALATRVSAGVYRYIFSADDSISAGVHKIHWVSLVAGVTKNHNDYVSFVDKYIDANTFFDLHPEYETEYEDHFDNLEKTVRGVIDTYCGQTFQLMANKTISLDGDGTKSLYLPARLDSFSVASIDTDEDVTDFLEKEPQTDWHLRFSKVGDATVGITRQKFPRDSTITITGDWGWPYVPTNVERAADLLIEDFISHDRENYRYGITRVWMDTQRFDFDPNIFSSTGNVDVDVLLMDYVILIFDMI